MNNKIYPLAYKLSPGQTCTLYYLGFPQTWKVTLLDIARKNNPRFKDEYGLPTNALKKLVDSWMEGVIALAPLKKDSHDEHWLTSCSEYSEKSIQALCSIIKVWVKATYVTAPRALPLIKKLANDFCDMINPKDLMKLQTTAEVCLTLEDGTVYEEAYQAIPLLAVNRLLGSEVVLSGQTLFLCYAAKNQLITHPIIDPKSHHQYSFVFDLSVQTTPPQRKALLLCQMSIRRWIPDNYNKEHAPFLSENISSHIKVSDSKYCQIPISYDYISKRLDWKAQDKECYNIWGYEQLPSADDVLKDPAAYTMKILLPYKNGMGGFVTSKIGTGVPVVDKTSLHQSLSALLGDIICEQPEANRVMLRGQKFSYFKSPQEYERSEDFRSWVSKCVETDQITFEIYGLWKDPKQLELLRLVQSKIEQDFGVESEASCLKIQCVCKETGNLADGMPDDYKQTKIQRCDEIVEQLGQADSVTACIFVLPGQEQYIKGDPKQVLRNAFARTGRVVQFINPEGEINPNKVDNAVYDLYRQLGIVTLLGFQKLPSLANTPCVGMHLCTQVHGVVNKARFLPIYVTVNVLEGKTRVHCDAFSNKTVSYREACLEMAKLFWENDLEQRCVDASRAPAKQKLIELKNRYYMKEDNVLFLIQSDGNTRAVWSGISDKEICGYTETAKYCPVQINVGTPKNPYPFSLVNSGVRIIRIRRNQEVPDYYTELSEKSTDDHLLYSSTSGIFKYEDVFWGIHHRQNADKQYINSFKDSRVDHPRDRFAEKDMIEFYPLQLQSDDDAAAWVFYTDALRHIPIQYNQSTVLPLPLHLAEALEEYLFNA